MKFFAKLLGKLGSELIIEMNYVYPWCLKRTIYHGVSMQAFESKTRMLLGLKTFLEVS